MRTKLLIVAAAFALALAACTQGRTTEPRAQVQGTIGASLPPEVLLLGTDHGPVTVSVPTGSVLFQDPAAVAGPGGARLYSASSDGRRTLLETLDAAGETLLSSTRIRGDLDVRVASGSGRTVALMEPLPQGVDAWTPVPRSRTTIVIADPTGDREPRRFLLHGNFEPEAFSVDDSRLFLIQHLPAEAPTVYRVTVLDLRDGDVRPVFGPFKTPPERMPGTRLSQVLSPDGKQLYTLYSTRPPAYAEGSGATPAGNDIAFVHVLNLKRGWAHCVGLREEFWGQPASAQAMAVSPDGRRLHVVDSIRGIVTVMDTSSLEFLRTQDVAFGFQGDGRTSAQMSVDGETLYVGAGSGSAVEAIDTTTLEVMHRWPMDGVVSALALSGDGARLYVALRDDVALLDAATGRQLAAVPFPGVESILQVVGAP